MKFLNCGVVQIVPIGDTTLRGYRLKRNTLMNQTLKEEIEQIEDKTLRIKSPKRFERNQFPVLFMFPTLYKQLRTLIRFQHPRAELDL